jgi:hypothetical protein
MKTTVKATILTKRKIEYLFDHILDGFKSSHQGAQYIRRDGIINDQEYKEILEKNSERLIQRIHEFKITHKLLSIGFAIMFTWMQVSGDDIDMRRSSRTRTNSRSQRSQRSGRRKHEH